MERAIAIEETRNVERAMKDEQTSEDERAIKIEKTICAKRATESRENRRTRAEQGVYTPCSFCDRFG